MNFGPAIAIRGRPEDESDIPRADRVDQFPRFRHGVQERELLAVTQRLGADIFQSEALAVIGKHAGCRTKARRMQLEVLEVGQLAVAGHDPGGRNVHV